jgi:hypothetical protein
MSNGQGQAHPWAGNEILSEGNSQELKSYRIESNIVTSLDVKNVLL